MLTAERAEQLAAIVDAYNEVRYDGTLEEVMYVDMLIAERDLEQDIEAMTVEELAALDERDESEGRSN